MQLILSRLFWCPCEHLGDWVKQVLEKQLYRKKETTNTFYIWIITEQGPSKSTDFSKCALFIMHQYEERVSSGKVSFKDKAGA